MDTTPDSAKTWVSSLPDDFPYDKLQPINEDDIFEVVGTMRDGVVEHDLRDRSFQKLDKDTAKNLTGAYYRCPQGKTPYLVRAVYGNARTGTYRFQRIGKKLSIDHASLGREIGLQKAAFVLNLDFEPELIYVTAGFAM